MGEDTARDTHGEGQAWVMLQLLQHRELQRLVQDEAAQMLEESSEDGWRLIGQVKHETQDLENQLWDHEKDLERSGVYLRQWLQEAPRCCRVEVQDHPNEVGPGGEKEILQTRTIPIEEVRKDLKTWIEPFKKEVDNLTSGPVVRLSAEEFGKLKEQEGDMQIIPMKLVATRKPNKLKGRIVACGNLADEYAHDDLAAGGACAIAVRTAIHVAARMAAGVDRCDRSVCPGTQKRQWEAHYLRTTQAATGHGIDAARRNAEGGLCAVWLR